MPEWHFSADHTSSDIDGKMLVINGQSETFFSHTTTRANGFTAGNYAASLFLMNVNTPGTFAPNPLLPVITFKVEYLDANNNWIQLANSPVSSSNVPQSANPTWVSLGGVFVLPSTSPFVVTQLRITLSDGVTGGCGNDFAIDDLKLASCPSGAPVPVKFLGINARQKGSGVLVSWSTAFENSNNYFDAERSIDGGLTWKVVSSIPSNGNSATTKNYSIYDAKPQTGNNLYRIKQVDLDGKFEYSPTASVLLSAETTGISVLSNPFASIINIDFLSNRLQQINCHLFDASGKAGYRNMIVVTKGQSRKQLDQLDQLASGLYILQLTGENGENLYSRKLVKE